MITIRKTRYDEAEKLRTLRLDSLLNTPDAFASSFEEEVGWTAEVYEQRQKSSPDNFIIGAFDDDKLIGMAGFAHERFRKNKHVGILWGMYVQPEYRKQNIGSRLVEKLVENARTFPHIEQINLGVVSTLIPAITLYEKMGFTLFGTEKNAMKDNDKYFHVLHYTLFLSSKLIN